MRGYAILHAAAIVDKKAVVIVLVVEPLVCDKVSVQCGAVVPRGDQRIIVFLHAPPIVAVPSNGNPQEIVRGQYPCPLQLLVEIYMDRIRCVLWYALPSRYIAFK